jgi:hypothetical protein
MSGSMPHDADDRVLWCKIEGDSTPFQVMISSNAFVSTLKESILEKRKHGLLRGVDAADLTLRKVRELSVKWIIR